MLWTEVVGLIDGWNLDGLIYDANGESYASLEKFYTETDNKWVKDETLSVSTNGTLMANVNT